MHLKTIVKGFTVLSTIATVVVAGNVGPGLQLRSAKAFTWTLQWSDEFSGAAGTGLDTSQWVYDIGTGWGNNQVENDTSSTANVYHDGAGHLAINPIHTSKSATAGWTSGRVETQRMDFAAPQGGLMAVEASIEQPDVTGKAAQGYWPAFWMLGQGIRSGSSWPGVGEIDVLEDIDGRSEVYGTLHCGTNPGGPCNETTGLSSGPQPCSGCQTAFHSYRVEYDRSVSPEELRWYLDGSLYHAVNATQMDATTWSNALQHGFFIILDVAIGGGFPGNPTKSTQSGVPMLVDYVRVYYGQ
jgi:beta-glucanase (GH16 family)